MVYRKLKPVLMSLTLNYKDKLCCFHTMGKRFLFYDWSKLKTDYSLFVKKT